MRSELGSRANGARTVTARCRSDPLARSRRRSELPPAVRMAMPRSGRSGEGGGEGTQRNEDEERRGNLRPGSRSAERSSSDHEGPT